MQLNKSKSRRLTPRINTSLLNEEEKVLLKRESPFKQLWMVFLKRITIYKSLSYRRTSLVPSTQKLMTDSFVFLPMHHRSHPFLQVNAETVHNRILTVIEIIINTKGYVLAVIYNLAERFLREAISIP